MKNTLHEYIDENGSCWICGKPRQWRMHGNRRHRMAKRRWRRPAFAAMMNAKKQTAGKIEVTWVAKHVTVLSTNPKTDTAGLAAEMSGHGKDGNKGPGILYWIVLGSLIVAGVLLAVSGMPT